VKTHAGYTVSLRPQESRGLWDGWGASLAWWGKGVGGSAQENLYADLFFTTQWVPFLGRSLPGLGLSILRYNIGGGGRPGDIPGHPEAVPTELPPYKDIDGFWSTWTSRDTASASFDWSRDERQLRMLKAGLARGVRQVELFANAPMWWMMTSKSSAGGELQAWNKGDFAYYLASVTRHLREKEQIPVTSVEPFNEPSAGWWTYPKGQEGCNIPVSDQAEVLALLREEMNKQNLSDVPIAASDENTMSSALDTLRGLSSRRVPFAGTTVPASTLVGRWNVHGYNGLEPWRDNGTRSRLGGAVRGTGRGLWMTEYGDGDGSGMALAQSITEDISFLQPSAWIYWQPAEPYSGWGLVNGAFDGDLQRPDRGAPTWVYTKYFVMAQFTRFLRPGQRIFASSDHNTISAYDAEGKSLTLITVNYGNGQPIRYDLSAVRGTFSWDEGRFTSTNNDHTFEAFQVPVDAQGFTLQAAPNTVYSVRLKGVSLP
jgi:galactan endo-1,6-beta-galactosidase